MTSFKKYDTFKLIIKPKCFQLPYILKQIFLPLGHNTFFDKGPTGRQVFRPATGHSWWTRWPLPCRSPRGPYSGRSSVASWWTSRPVPAPPCVSSSSSSWRDPRGPSASTWSLSPSVRSEINKERIFYLLNFA